MSDTDNRDQDTLIRYYLERINAMEAEIRRLNAVLQSVLDIALSGIDRREDQRPDKQVQ